MEVYLVFEHTVEHFDSDLCYDADGYYDDYYEREFNRDTVIGVYSTEKAAEKRVEEEENKNFDIDTEFYYQGWKVEK